MSDIVFGVDNLVKNFDGVRAVDHASFEIRATSITALIGPNGAGKTTLFNLVSGLVPADEGKVTFHGRELTQAAPHRVAGAGLIRTFQRPRTILGMTVRENLHLAAQGQPGEKLRGLLFNRHRTRYRETQVAERADELIDLFTLGRVADDYGGTLSGGQRKLLELARALMAEPKMLLLDEPLAGVNPTLGLQIEELIARLRSERNLTVLFIEHDLPAVMRLSDWVIVMNQGAVMATGSPETVRNDRAVHDAYLGRHADDLDSQRRS